MCDTPMTKPGPPQKITILYSGGLDSYLMWHWALCHYPDADVRCIFYSHGQDSEEEEIKRLPGFVEVKQLDWLDNKTQALPKDSDPFAGSIYIPGRNLAFSVLAACQTLPDEIWLGTVVDEDNQQATDKNDQFRRSTSELLSYVLSPFIAGVRVRFPFVEANMTKENAVFWAMQNGVSWKQLVDDTTSCWHHEEGKKACGVCKQCLKRLLVFGLNGFSEEYEIHPLDSQVQRNRMLDYVAKYVRDPQGINADEQNMADMIIRYNRLNVVSPQRQFYMDLENLIRFDNDRG